VQVRIPRPLHRNVRACAKLYKAPVPVFLRDMIAATCSGDMDTSFAFQSRLSKGMIEARQRELGFDSGKLVLGRPGEAQKQGYKALR
jgi:hypothetical protein